ncbi:hypothetical protein Dvina_19515 [Dactylosporangium vinaceum]|uniref:Integral membrane protein n=1 Tax=Dactylosporangium vinaceum TaxID=53362 RepID=A0ABV5M9K1_9ACTN|nr:hypothetical protein [Dactylosporangium vinaceum]UAC00050.1 hypothetical protein Dvina_19515 [Dactylosporangium vinaceum]
MAFPHSIADLGDLGLLSATIGVLGAYLSYAIRLARHPAPAVAPGTWFGLAAAACWAIEIWAGGPAALDHHTERAIGAAFALSATAITLAAGLIAGLRTRDQRTIWHTGLLAGTISGAGVCAFAVFMTLMTLPALGRRADYQAQFLTSHRPAMHDFLVNDILGAAAAHLIINVLLGVLGAAAGFALLALRGISATAAPHHPSS